MSKIVLWFVKITGWIPNLLYLRRKTYYLKNNKKIKKNKEAAVIISNHTSLIDFPLYMYTFLGSTIRPLVAEITYNKNPLMRTFLKLLGGIKVDRDSFDFSFLGECINSLEKKHSVLIFPEGRLPKKDETELLPFKPSFVYIALESNAPIIPIYTNGKYGFKGKTRVIVGEKIYVSDLMDENKSTEENINNICNYFRDYIIKLRDELNEKEKTNKKSI